MKNVENNKTGILEILENVNNLPSIPVVLTEVNKLLKDQHLYESMSQAHNPYGDGKTCQKIINIIKEENAK